MDRFFAKLAKNDEYHIKNSYFCVPIPEIGWLL